MTTTITDDAVAFFREHAGTSYYPGRETPEEGAERGARALAAAEAAYLADADTFVVWEVDDIDSSDFDDESEPHALHCARLCVAVDRTNANGIEHPRSGEVLIFDLETCSERSGRVVESLGGIDLGADGDPSSDPYARVIVAELYMELEARRESNISRGEN